VISVEIGDGGSVRSLRGLGESTLKTALLVDVAFYAVCCVYAGWQALTSEFYGFRVWGNFAIAGYALAALHTGWLLARLRAQPAGLEPTRSRWAGIGFIGAFAMVIPLIVLVIRRLTGVDWLVTPVSWSAQPEVWVIERSASLLLRTGTPYVNVFALGRPPEVNDYTPYGPVMTLFGMPRALLGGNALANALTDARLYFALVAIVCVVATLKLLNLPKVPLRAAQLAVAFPLTTLSFATSGPDLAIVALLVLGCALAARDHPVLAAVVLAAAGNAKLNAMLAVPVVAFLVAARLGKGALGRFLLWIAGVTVVVNVPVALVDPRSFVEHVLRFPAGLGAVTSPAASPLPGHLIAATGPVGQVVSFLLLAGAAVAIAVWLIRKPPVTGSDTTLRLAIGLAAFALLTPATRFGYLVYPLVLLGAALTFRSSEAQAADDESLRWAA
jgi:Glycosyltransferase family 87